MSTIEIENIGPVKSLSIPIPEQGGLVVLKGTQGTGKSTVQRAVRRLNGSDDPLEKRDGTTGGSVSGLGVSITVKKSIRRTGELEVESIEGRFSIDDLVDPQIDDPVKADAKRIKALLQLAGADPIQFIGRFEELLGKEQFYRICDGIEVGGDIVATAAKIKRAIEKAARDIEASADKATGEAKAFKTEAAGFEGVELRDPAELQADLEDAIRREAAIKAEAKAAKEKIEAANRGREVLEDAKTAFDVLSVEEAQAALTVATEAVLDASRKVENLTRELVAAQQAEAEAERAEDQAEQALKAATDHRAAMAGWQAAIDEAANVTPPDEGQLAGAAEAVALARSEIEKQALARKAKAAEQSAITAEAQAKQHRERAESLRKAAAKTDDVLSEAVGGIDCPLRVKDDRLVLDTHRGEEHYGELSDGLRILHAVPIAAKNMPEHAMLTIEQWLYGELAPASRAILHKTLVECGVVGIAVEATDDPEIYAKVFDG